MTLLEGLKINNHEAAPYVILVVILFTLLLKSEEPHHPEARNALRFQHGRSRSRFLRQKQSRKALQL